LPAALVERYSIRVVPIPFVFGDRTFKDGVDITPDEFYARMATSQEMPKTSPPEPGAYLFAWEAALRECADVLHVSLARRVSTFDRSTSLAAAEFTQRHPEACIRVLDSGSAAMGQGFVALAAARAAAARGLSLDGVCEVAKAVADKVSLVVALDTLRYLARTSRIPQVAALVSSLLDLKPIVCVERGEVRPLERVRTRQRSLQHLLAAVCGGLQADAPVHLAVHHAQAPETAEWLSEEVRLRCNVVESYVTEFTPVMGAYCGPGLVGAAFYPQMEDVTC